MTIVEGHRFDLHCNGTSLPIFNVSWYKDSALISNIAPTYNDISDINRIATLTITSANTADDGLYKCILTNTLGSLISTAIKVEIQCKYNNYKFIDKICILYKLYVSALVHNNKLELNMNCC